MHMVFTVEDQKYVFVKLIWISQIVLADTWHICIISPISRKNSWNYYTYSSIFSQEFNALKPELKRQIGSIMDRHPVFSTGNKYILISRKKVIQNDYFFFSFDCSEMFCYQICLQRVSFWQTRYSSHSKRTWRKNVSGCCITWSFQTYG